MINSTPQIYDPDELSDLEPLDDPELDALREEIYEIIRTINDPEHPYTLEELKVVKEAAIMLSRQRRNTCVKIIYMPTVPHCSLATLIGLCIRRKLVRDLGLPHIKLDIVIKPGMHDTEQEINRQINDKERVNAALDNPLLSQTVERLIRQPAYGHQ